MAEILWPDQDENDEHDTEQDARNLVEVLIDGEEADDQVEEGGESDSDEGIGRLRKAMYSKPLEDSPSETSEEEEEEEERGRNYMLFRDECGREQVATSNRGKGTF